MPAFALVFAFLLQDGGTPPNIDNLVRSLGSDSIETRAAAVADLVRLGPAALPAIRKACEAARDANVRMHLESAVRRIELDEARRHFKGGNTVAGLRARIALAQPKKRPKAGEKVELTIEFMNVSENHVSFVPPDSWDTSLPGSSVHCTSAQAELEVEQVTGERDSSCSGLLG